MAVQIRGVGGAGEVVTDVSIDLFDTLGIEQFATRHGWFDAVFT